MLTRVVVSPNILLCCRYRPVLGIIAEVVFLAGDSFGEVYEMWQRLDAYPLLTTGWRSCPAQ